eukprot:6888257-Pyramimonas_sp.AAC.1
MRAINTTRPLGDTYFGMKGSSSQIDYICLPQSAQVLVQWVQKWKRTAETTRAFVNVLDHVPLVMKLQVVAPVNLTLLRE